MSHTNSTTNYSLPQFLTTDKPAWLTDVNNAYLAIDTAMKNNADAASLADTKATNAGTAATNADTKATAAKTASEGAVGSLADAFSDINTYSVGAVVTYNSLLYQCTVAVTTPGAWTGSANWTRVTLDGLKQNATDNALTTTSKTVAGAINELNSGKANASYLSVKETFAEGTSLVSAVSSLISTYGKNNMLFAFVISGYGWVEGVITFYDANQGGGYVICNGKGKNGTPQLYTFMYVNGTITLGFPWDDPNS